MKRHRTSRLNSISDNGPNGLVELLQKAMLGDPLALAELGSLLDPLLRSIVGRFRLEPADAHDVVQSVWVRFLEHRHTIRAPERAVGWLRTTARREALRHLSHRCREQVRASRDEVPAPRRLSGGTPCFRPTQDSPEERVLRSERDRCVWRAAERLEPRDRLLATLIAHETEATYALLAARMGVREGSVGQLRGRCFARLRRLLAEEGITGTGL